MRGYVLVTGASGFIGKRLVAALAEEGWQVRAAARDPVSIPATSRIERIAMADLARAADWTALFEGATHVVHLAGIAHAPGALPDAAYSRINAEAVGEMAQSSARQDRALRVHVLGARASRVVVRAPDY